MIDDARNAGTDITAVFNALPDPYWVVDARDYRIVAASDAFLAATRTQREDVVGRLLFDVFPANPDDPVSVRNINALRESLDRVKKTGQPDQLPSARYPIRRPASAGGGFEERYWNARNTPVFDANGKLTHIVHRTQDVTELVLLRQREDEAREGRRRLESRAEQMEADILERNEELKRLNRHLSVAQEVAGVGSWELDLDSMRHTWSDEVFRILGVPREHVAEDVSIDALIERLVHPDDRATVEDVSARIGRGEDVPDVEHRVVHPDGDLRHVRERIKVMRDDAGRPVRLFGTIEDVTERKHTEERLRRDENLLRIAGRMAKLGAWQLDVDARRVTWSEEVSAIHEVEHSRSIGFDEARRFIAPEWRKRVNAALERAIRGDGDYDEEFEIITAKGNRRRVRAMGQVLRDEHGRVGCVRGALQDITQQKEAEREINELAQRLQTTLESISDALLVVDNDWHVTFMNSQAERVLRTSRASVLGRNVWDLYDEDKHSPFAREYRRAKHEQRTVSIEDYSPQLGIWLDVTAYPSTTGLTIYFRDVTERKRAELAMRQSEERFRMVARSTADTVWDWDLARDAIWWNDGLQTVFGYAAQETDLQFWSDRIHPDDRARVLEALHGSMNSAADEWHSEYRFRRRNGSYAIVVDRGYIMRDANGKALRMVGGINDITEQRQYQNKVTEQAALLDKAQDAIIVRDLDGVVTYWNRSAERIYGWRAAEAVGRPVEHLLYPDPTAYRGALDTLMRNGEWTGEIEQHRKDGTSLIVEGAWTLVRDETGAPKAVLAINTDVTRRLELEEQLRQSQRLESIGQLTGGVAHDFNNLLTVLLGNAELMADQLPAGSHLHRLALMSRTAAQRGSELTHRLLAFARRQALAPEVIDVNEHIMGMENLLRRTLPESIDIEVCPFDAAWPVDVDPAQLESVLLNLALNAKDAMPQRGHLMIETANVQLDEAYTARHAEVQPGEYTMIAVSDTGTGIPPELIDRVFDPFFTTKEKGKGTGLGLSMAYGFARQSGGHINIYSEPGKGTTVKLYLPKAARERKANGPAPPVEQHATGSEKVLIVEDDDLVREHAHDQLQAFGYNVLTASNGAEAMRIVQHEQDIDLLFTDVIMSGGMNGPDLVAMARRIRPKLKVLYTSGYTENAIVHQGRLDPGVYLLQKPYQRADLASKVREVLDGRER